MSAPARGIASAQISRGSRTCIIVGALDPVENLDLSEFHTVLWFSTAAPAAVPARFRARPEGLTTAVPGTLSQAQLDAMIDRCILRDSLSLPSVFLTEDAVGAAAPQFLPVVDAILTQCDGHRRARVTRQEVGFRWQTHLLTNLPAYARQRLPRAWAGALTGVPAFVCGAGPSLDVSAPALARVAGHGVVLAADSALSALSRHAVPVDFAVTVDAAKAPEKCLPADGARPRRLVMASVSPEAWRSTLPETAVTFVSSNQITEDWLTRCGLPKTDFLVQGNCGITAVELALYLGCGPIYLFGMDNAVNTRTGGQLHQQHYASGPAPRKTYPKIPGNYEPEVEAPFLREWRILDTRCATLPAGLVVNVNDRGARLQNTTLVHPDGLDVVAPAIDVAARCGALAPVDALDARAWEQVAAAIHAQVSARGPQLNAAAQAARRGDRARALQALSGAFQDAGFRQLLGNYSLKVLPRLLAADQTDLAGWATMIDEARQLLALAAQIP